MAVIVPPEMPQYSMMHGGRKEEPDDSFISLALDDVVSHLVLLSRQ
jgi:hypothetical protein